MSPSKSFWKSIPRTSLFGFLLGVFFIFSTMGLTTDIMDMGREPAPRFVLGVLLSGVFAMVYAFTGFVLRKQFSCWLGPFLTCLNRCRWALPISSGCKAG